MLIVDLAWIAWFVYWNIAGFWTNKTKSTENQLQRLSHAVPLGLGLFLIFWRPRHPFLHGMLLYHVVWKIAGLALTFAGMGFMVWARVHLGRYWSGYVTLKEGHRLIRTGPYALVRHPIYTGFVAAALGSAMVAGTGDALAGVVLVLIAFLFKIPREERILKREFADEFDQFRRKVPRLIPFVKLT
jgi:protein-S-isoprenylcysteine O-methyltransferase Ste14